MNIIYTDHIAEDDPVNKPHRDQDYIILFQQKGYFNLVVDDQLVKMKGRSVYYILPGQLHYHQSSETESWIIALNSSLVQKTLRSKLNEHYYDKQAVPISAKKAGRLMQSIAFLAEELRSPSYCFSRQAVRNGLVSVISGMTTEEYVDPEPAPLAAPTRFAEITRDFKELVLKNFRIWKKPSVYANALHLSVAYLNQAIKNETGHTVTFWIQEMLTSEARYLLSSTDKAVKEIACELGYIDQGYFSRLFSRTQKMSPLKYRSAAQEQSGLPLGK
jgi:AraC-like DNA-binding protein